MDRDDLEASFKHFTHPHPLKLVQVVYPDNSFKCYCCRSMYKSNSWAWTSTVENEKIQVYMYACKECNSRDGLFEGGVCLCLVCAELGESVERPALHPCHPLLKLVHNRLPSYVRVRKCHGCCENIWHKFSYHCDDDQCDFELHVQCAHSLKPTLQLPSDSHPHPLSLILRHEFADSGLNCEFCHSAIRACSSFARCVPCNLNFHISCHRADYRLPDLIKYSQGHSEHPLSLAHKQLTYWSCDVCSQKRDWPILHYTCFECNNFAAHISCIFQSSFPCPFSNLVTNVVLSDPLTNCGQVHKSTLCQGCKKPMLSNGLFVYGCQYCNLFIHESCVRQWLQQPLVVGDKDKDEKTLICSHPGYDLQHDCPLVLVFAHGDKGFRCACCSRNCIGFMFQKKDDETFVLDLECMLVVPTLELIGHDHLVTLLQRGGPTKSCYLRCIPCRDYFEIRESLCLFPRTILHECHFHPLTLVPNIRDEGTDQSYCDVCEDERYQEECIYYCPECKFEAQIGCVKSKVLGPSANKLKQGQFVTLQELQQNEEKTKKKIQIKDVFCLKEELLLSCIHDHKEFNDIFQASSEITWESFDEDPSRSSDCSNNFFYSDEPFKEFIERIKSTSTRAWEKMCAALQNLKNEEVVRVGEYLVPLDFYEVLETLFDKYGDFGAKCTYSREVKQYLFVAVCKTLQKMCDIKVVQVTESLLMDWWTWIAMGEVAGFEIQFALESWKRVVLAHFGLEADRHAMGELRSVRQQMKELPEQIEDIERVLEGLEKMLDERRRMFNDATIKEKDLRETVFRVKKSPLMKKCLKEAEDLVCYTVGDTFLPLSD